MQVRGRAVLAGALVAGAVLTGCGSSASGIPSDASVKSFCSTSDTFAKATRFADGVKAAAKLHDTGTPHGIPADARKGFEEVVSLVTASKSQNDLKSRYQKLTTAQKKSVQSLDAYIRKTC